MNMHLLQLAEEMGLKEHTSPMVQEASDLFSDESKMPFEELVQSYKSFEEWERNDSVPRQRPNALDPANISKQTAI